MNRYLPVNKSTAYISVGSNMGDPLANCREGIRRLCDGSAVALMAQSPFYRTQPVDLLDQDWFINAAIKVSTGLTPPALMERMQAVQNEVGRKPSVRFGPRILDLDIIFFDDRILDDPDLTIPHPRMHKRRFVLQPICDIDPQVFHPVLRLDVKTLLHRIAEDGQKIERCLNC
jgi:2-amino-4-hydroxy-6-hydroxymethyldihydropteridine diphosphokinase